MKEVAAEAGKEAVDMGGGEKGIKYYQERKRER